MHTYGIIDVVELRRVKKRQTLACNNFYIKKGKYIMNKIIVLTSNDTIETADYTNYCSIQAVVGGNIEFFHSTKIPVMSMFAHGESVLPVTMYCNEEFLIDESEDFNKLNAVASLISGQEIRGKVAILVDTGDGENRGFEYLEEETNGEITEAFCECWTAMETLRRFISDKETAIRELHQKYDNIKSDPMINIVSSER